MQDIQSIDKAKRPRRSLSIAGAIVAILVGVAGAQAASPVDHVDSGQAKVAHHHWYQFGIASWYGRFFQGKTTASGQPYNEDDMTCAHRSLPLGSVLRVTNLRNHRSVVVRVNDRGPMPEDRVIDLSRAAAESLGFSQRGLAPVRIDLLAAPTEVAQLSPSDDTASAR